ncbi:hypothetical protein ONZ51_g12798 [Trametes cubensis]|uniref:Uncharacterized protein n=1 Tax=Trametes cubensis TaxID=1111947 RepID=A0AAD7X4C2_9APHY|nr:hypothetical protein ONZ51_g12798 [Trametes cubensis]
MRTSALSAFVILGATLASGSPLRVVVTTHQEFSNYGSGPLPAVVPADAQLAHIAHPVEMITPGVGFMHGHAANSEYNAMISNSSGGNGRHLCQRLREKALEVSNKFRSMFSLAPIEVTVTPYRGGMEGPDRNLVHILPVTPPGGPMPVLHAKPIPTDIKGPILPFIGTPVRPAFAQGEEGWAARPGGHRFRHHRGSFLRRVHHALMVLGPWEGRAVAFVLGAAVELDHILNERTDGCNLFLFILRYHLWISYRCGIGVLLRMVWVMVLVTARAIRGPSRRSSDIDSAHDGYDIVVFDEDAEEILVPPPQYTVVVNSEAVPVGADEKTRTDGEKA